MRSTLTFGLLGALAVAAGVLLVRQQQRTPQRPKPLEGVPAGETQPAEISPDKLRVLGF